MAYTRNAIATEATCSSLFALAEELGEAVCWLDSEHACTVLRNRLYKYRAKLRKNAAAVTGVASTPYDGFTFGYAEVDSRWRFVITYDLPMLIEIEIPDWVEPESLPHFDVPEADFEGVMSEIEIEAGPSMCGVCGHYTYTRCSRPDCGLIPF